MEMPVDRSSAIDFKRFLRRLALRQPTLLGYVFPFTARDFRPDNVVLQCAYEFEVTFLEQRRARLEDELGAFFRTTTEGPQLTIEKRNMATSGEASTLNPAWVHHLQRQGFELRERLGTGAFGVVFRAHQPSLLRDVAVKFFSGLLKGEGNRKRFMREAKLLAQIDHPSVPFVITRGDIPTDKTPYFVMQLVRGKRLSSVIHDRRRAMELKESARVILDVLSALESAHEADVVHRDVRPDNIMITPAGRAVLLDFSLGISLEYSPGLTRATEPNERAGDPHYASPEQMANARDVDHRADIYSTGVVLFECIARHARIRVNELERHISNPILADVIARACNPDREERYTDATAFRAALRTFAENAPEESELAICPNPGCASGVFSPHGYFLGPSARKTRRPCCSSCGSRLLRACSQCSHPIPDNIEELVVTRSKSGQDHREAYCGCGEKLFETPVCGKCGSFLRQGDLGKNTANTGCASCQKRDYVGYGSNQPPPLDDSDIPF